MEMKVGVIQMMYFKGDTEGHLKFPQQYQSEQGMKFYEIQWNSSQRLK